MSSAWKVFACKFKPRVLSYCTCSKLSPREALSLPACSLAILHSSLGLVLGSPWCQASIEVCSPVNVSGLGSLGDCELSCIIQSALLLQLVSLGYVMPSISLTLVAARALMNCSIAIMFNTCSIPCSGCSHRFISLFPWAIHAFGSAFLVQVCARNPFRHHSGLTLYLLRIASLPLHNQSWIPRLC